MIKSDKILALKKVKIDGKTNWDKIRDKRLYQYFRSKILVFYITISDGFFYAIFLVLFKPQLPKKNNTLKK